MKGSLAHNALKRGAQNRIQQDARSYGTDDVVVLKGLKAGEHIATSANFLIDSESQLQAAIGSFAPPPPVAGAAASMNGPQAPVTIDYSSNPPTPQPGTNDFRVKKADRQTKCCTVPTREVVNGKSIVENLEFADYDSLEDSCRDYALSQGWPSLFSATC